MAFLLVTGVPGTGKTHLGNHLQSVHGFLHLDMETQPVALAFGQNREQFVSSLSGSVVITWGFIPQIHGEHILFLKNRGFFLVWMDGNRAASFKAFMRRGDISEAMYYQQMLSIEVTQIIQRVEPVVRINPFQNDETFRPIKDIAQEVLALAYAKAR
jgi:hypothetical protein